MYLTSKRYWPIMIKLTNLKMIKKMLLMLNECLPWKSLIMIIIYRILLYFISLFQLTTNVQNLPIKINLSGKKTPNPTIKSPTRKEKQFYYGSILNYKMSQEILKKFGMDYYSLMRRIIAFIFVFFSILTFGIYLLVSITYDPSSTYLDLQCEFPKFS